MPEPTMDETTTAPPTPPPQCLETRDSISSIDSDVSLSFDRPPATKLDQTKDEDDEGAHMADLSDSASETGSSGGGKDSGCEVTPEASEQSFAPPSAELADRIVAQVEFYFSDANIAKDAFLLKHVRRNKEGYVSLKLISSFKRVKHITKDWRVVAHALERSDKLEINDAGTKLRRLQPLPAYDETTPSRTVVVARLPLERPTIEDVAELLRPCGEIALIRILRPGNPVPADVRQFVNKHPTLAGAPCALVEFVASESARAARALDAPPLKVYELNAVPHPERKKKPAVAKKQQQQKHQQQQHYYAPPTGDSECSDADCETRARLRRGSAHCAPPKCGEPAAAWLQRRLSASSTEASFMFLPRRLSYGGGGREASEAATGLFVPRRASAVLGGGATFVVGGQQYQQFVPRRLSSGADAAAVAATTIAVAAAAATAAVGSPRSRSNSLAFQNENVVRMPKGPDGSKGFRQHRPSLGTIYS